MSKRLYVVRIDGGSNHPNYKHFLTNVSELKAVPTGYSGITNTCLISHHMDPETIHLLATNKFRSQKNKDAVTVEEVTKKTIGFPSGEHRVYLDTIENYFLPHDKYPNIK